MNKQEYETLRDAAAEHLVESEREMFTVGADFAYDLMQSRIAELEDKLYHESRNAPEVEYKLGHKIEQLEAKLAICKEALKIYSDAHYNRAYASGKYAKEALAQLEGKAE